MCYLFSYTECEAPGPFQERPGFKIKSLSMLQGDEATPEVERILNSTIANFPEYLAPKVDPYSSRDEFLNLHKVWAYLPVVDGYFAFMRLATSGLKMGRPGNPFHQAIALKFTSFERLSRLASASGLKNLRPSDLYFWEWSSPRGDSEVEEHQFPSGTMPIPAMSEFEIADRFEAHFQTAAGLTMAHQFEAMWLSGTVKQAEIDEAGFFSLLSMLTRMVPAPYAWSGSFASEMPFRQLEEIDPDLAAGFFRSESPVESSDLSVFWTELFEFIVENGLQLEIADQVEILSGIFSYSLRNKRQALSFMPLAALVLPDPEQILVGSGLREAAWEVLKSIDSQLKPKDLPAAEIFRTSFLSQLGVSDTPSEAKIWLSKLVA